MLNSNRTITATLRYSPGNGLTLLGGIRAGCGRGPEQSTERQAEIAMIDHRLLEMRRNADADDTELAALESRLGKLLAQDVAEQWWDLDQAWDDLLEQWTLGQDIYCDERSMQWMVEREKALSTLNALAELASHLRSLNDAEQSVVALQVEKTKVRERLAALTKDLLPEHAANLEQVAEIGARLPGPSLERCPQDATIRLLVDLALTGGRAVALARTELTRVEAELQAATDERDELREQLTTSSSVWPYEGDADLDAQLTTLETRLPAMSASERAAVLETMPAVGRERLAVNPRLVDTLRDALSPPQLAQTAAQLIVRAPSEADLPVSARHAVESQVARMLSDPDVAAQLLKDGGQVVIVPHGEDSDRS